MNTPRRLLKTTSIRNIEHLAQAALPPQALMRRAADAARDLVLRQWPGHAVVVLCGPGNNGGDGLMLARLLHQAGRSVRIWALPAASRPDDAGQAWRELPPGLLQTAPLDAGDLADPGHTLIVDALFGIGLSRPLPPEAQRWTAWANRQGADILALDVPSGLDADTGNAQPATVAATHTLTFIADKPGLHTRAGQDQAGRVSVADLDLGTLVCAQAADAGYLVGMDDCPALFQARLHDTHKGSFGTLGLVAGAAGMTGAALLAGRAALLSGAGKVFVGLADTAPLSMACDLQHPELMLRTADSLLDQGAALGVTTWIAGCGLGDTSAAHQLLARLLHAFPTQPLVLDADALTCIAALPELEQAVATRAGPCVLTPHPREAARLLHTGTDAIQADRIAAARAIAGRYRAWAVLKGAGTVVAAPDGAWSINGSGNAGLATAGTGDVLSGMLGALLAQGLDTDAAVRGGVWLHGAAADRLVQGGAGPIGLTASEVALAARTLRNGG